MQKKKQTGGVYDSVSRYCDSNWCENIKWILIFISKLTTFMTLKSHHTVNASIWLDVYHQSSVTTCQSERTSSSQKAIIVGNAAWRSANLHPPPCLTTLWSDTHSSCGCHQWWLEVGFGGWQFPSGRPHSDNKVFICLDVSAQSLSHSTRPM